MREDVFYNGSLRCHRFKNFELKPAEGSSFAHLRIYYMSALDASIQSKSHVKEIEAIIEGKKPNAQIIQFSDYLR